MEENNTLELDEMETETKEKKKTTKEILEEVTTRIKELSEKKSKELSLDEKVELIELKAEQRKLKERIKRQKEQKTIRGLKKLAQKGTDQAFLNNLHAWGLTDENELKAMKRVFDCVKEYGITTTENLKAVLELAKQNKPDLLK